MKQLARTTRYLAGLALGLVLLCGGSSPTRAEEQAPVLVALGQWQLKGSKPQLSVSLEGALTGKQKSIINGGFTTVSQLIVREAAGGAETKTPAGRDKDRSREEGTGRIVYKVRCSVKFDAWEENYDIARLDEAPRTALVRRLSEYGDLCLKAEVSDLNLIERLSKDGGTLYAVLVVKQMSSDEAAKIKEWLIQQQSGVMQSLFSHMLGEMTVNQTAHFRISVPPRPRGGAQIDPTQRFGRTPPEPSKTPAKG